MRNAILLSTILGLATLFLANSSQAIDLPKATCNESVFKPCICASKSPPQVKFRPRHGQCGGKAAAILEGEFANSFSVVLRDRLNRDRYPSVGFNGCTKAQADMGLAKCSAYKCQKTIRSNGKYVCCFGGAGTSSILSKVTRLTIKLKDSPNDSNDPLARICLPLFSAKYKMN